jgi:cytochrome c6
MKNILHVFVYGMGVCLLVMTGSANGAQQEHPGAAAFREYCLVCHPGGGNIFDPGKSLHRKDMEAHNIKTPEDIIRIIRNPGPLMTRFDENAIPDRVAKDIGEYILENFK